MTGELKTINVSSETSHLLYIQTEYATNSVTLHKRLHFMLHRVNSLLGKDSSYAINIIEVNEYLQLLKYLTAVLLNREQIYPLLICGYLKEGNF